MEKIREFLKTHHAISYNWLGVQLGLPVGRLRADRAIPKKYLVEAEKILMGYGYLPSVDSVNEMVTGETWTPKAKLGVRMTPDIKEIEKDFIGYPKTHVCRNGVLGILDGGLFKRSLFDEGDYFVKKL
jgi:hypothetical protein